MADAKRKGPSIFGIAGVKKRIKNFRNDLKKNRTTGQKIKDWFKNFGYGLLSLLLLIPKTITFAANALIEVADKLNFATQVLYLVLSVWGLVYVSNIDTAAMIGQDEQHVGLFILLAQSIILLFSVVALILFFTLVLVKLFGEDEKSFQKTLDALGGVFSGEDTFEGKYQQFIAPLQYHMLTVILFSSVFIYVNEDLKTKLAGSITGDQWLIPFITFVGVLRAIIEFRHSRDARNIKKVSRDVYLGTAYGLEDEYANKPMRGPALGLGTALLVYNLHYSNDDMWNGYSLMFNVALIVYLAFVAIEKWYVGLKVRDGDGVAEYFIGSAFEWGYGDAWASIGLASTVMVIFSAFSVADKINKDVSVEGALVAALGAVILDISRLGYGSMSKREKDTVMSFLPKGMAVIYRAAHLVVGILGLLSVYMKDEVTDAKLGVIEPLRLFVVVASLVKITGFFYSFHLPTVVTCPPKIGIVPGMKENVENTLRQGSTIVLLLSSTILENSDAENDGFGWGSAILLTSVLARFVDCMQDQFLDYGADRTALLGNWKEVRQKDILSPTADNPRSWLVLGGLISVAVLLSDVINRENAQTDYGDNNKLLDGTENVFNGWIITSLVLVLAHILLVVFSLFAGSDESILGKISFSRIPLFRWAVTTLVLIGLAVCAGVMNIGYNEVSPTSPSPSKDPFTPNWSQLHLLAAIVIYIFTDMIGHVFL